MDTKVLTAHVPLALAKKVDKLAEKLERSRGWVVKQALSAWVEQEKSGIASPWRPWPMSTRVDLLIIRPFRLGPIA